MKVKITVKEVWVELDAEQEKEYKLIKYMFGRATPETKLEARRYAYSAGTVTAENSDIRNA